MSYLRQPWRAALLFTGVILLTSLYAYMTAPLPSVIQKWVNGSQIYFASNDVRLPLEDGCIVVRWRVQNVRAVELNDRGVVGEGEERLCDDEAARLDVTLADGVEQTFRLHDEAVLEHPWVWLLLLAGVAAIERSGFISGFARALIASHFGLVFAPLALWLRLRLMSLRTEMRAAFTEPILRLLRLFAIWVEVVHKHGIFVPLRLLAGALMNRASGVRRALARDGMFALTKPLLEESRALLRHTTAVVRAENRWHLAALAAVVCLGVALRLHFLDQPMRDDESVTFVQYASQPLARALSDYSTPNNHLFHTLLVHLSYRLFGDSPLAIRLPAFLAGILTIPALYLAARLLYNKEAALLAAELGAASMGLIAYSTNARGYSIIALCFLLLLALAAYLRRRRSAPGWLLFALLAIIGCYTVPIMIYPLAIVVVWLGAAILLDERERGAKLLDLTLTLLLIGGVVGALYLPVISRGGMDAVTENRFVESLEWADFMRRLPETLSDVWAFWHTDIHPALVALLALGALTAFVFHRRLASTPFSLLLVSLAVVAAGMLAQQVVGYPRVWLFLLPAYLMSAAAGLALLLRALPARRTALVALAVVVSAFGSSWTLIDTNSAADYDETGYFPDAEDVTDYLAKIIAPEDRILSGGRVYGILNYYFYRHDLPLSLLNRAAPFPERVYLVLNEGSDTVEDLLDEYDAAELRGFSEPEQIGEVGDALIYRMERADMRLPLPALAF